MNKKNITGALKVHVMWPVLLIPFLLIMVLQLYSVDISAGVIGTIYLVVYSIIALILYNFNHSSIMCNIINYAKGYNMAQKYLLDTMDIPYAHLDIKGNIIWCNEQFRTLIGYNYENVSNVADIFPEITIESLPASADEGNIVPSTEYQLNYEQLHLRARINRLDLHEFDFAEDEINLSLFKNSDTLFSLYIYDETELVGYINKLEDQDAVIGLLYIDNYEDSLAGCDEIQRSLLMALVERQIAKYIQELDGIYRKIEKDRYFFIFQHKYLEVVQNNKFSILEAVRNVTVGNDDFHVSISIGLGIHAESYTKRYEYARTAIDLALGRGGDQAVVKAGDNIVYYGGKSIQKDSNTRVRARVKAHALNELMLAAEQIYIMGHCNGDIDSFGASIGIFRIAKALERKAIIVIDPNETYSIRPMLDRFESNPYYEDMIIDCAEAEANITPNTLLVVVDVNHASRTQCPVLCEKTNNIVVIDHHRQNEKRIDNQVLSYIEPFASSSSEMVTEFFQYIGDGITPKPLEADTLYAGIMVDTNNFTTQTNVRTFEAVAYLKRNGADVTRVRKIFRSSPSDYLACANVVSNSSVYMEHFAIATIAASDQIANSSLIAAKSANMLLEMGNIKASFVLSENNSKVHISARSIDEANVQIIMEKLGGGGHVSSAATQLECSLEEALQQLKDTLDTMIKEGDIE